MSRNVTFADSVETNPRPQQLACPNCGSTHIDHHDASGASICTECGVVVEENAIVSAVEFVEGAGGASSMVGQFVSATSSKAYTGQQTRGGRYGFSRDSRETTLANGRRRIQEVASRLRLGTHYVDAAHRLFTIAVEKNFVQGRRTIHVVAACLYIACRQEKSQHMLIDFSDALQVNVFTLGACFLKFRRLLGLKLELIDPALYIYRFAAHLDLEEKANTVALTALRLVARMKRDWIVTGRRPAGICAAALLIGARAHGFQKDHQDVTRILRVCGLTVTTRVKEFEHTPSAQLTLEQFNAVDLETEEDPPVYRKNKILEARAKAIREGNIELLMSGILDDPVSGKRAVKWRTTRKLNERKSRFKELYEAIEQDLKALENAEENEELDPAGGETNVAEEGKQGQIVVQDVATTPLPVNLKEAYPRSRYGKAIILPDHATPEEMEAPAAPVESVLKLEEWKRDLPESIDKEIDDMFRTDEEEKQKEAIFIKINKDYLEQQERKENERLSLEAATKDQELDDVAQAEGHARYKSNRSGRKRKGDDSEGPSTTEEALLAAVSSRRISRKINYDALSSLFDDDGSFSTDAIAAGGNEDPGLLEMM